MEATFEIALVISAAAILAAYMVFLLRQRRRLLNRADIVRQQLTQAKHEASELSNELQFLERILNSISDPIFVKDRHHRLVYVNEAECRLSGLAREDMLGKTDYDFFPREQVDVFWQKDDRVLETGQEDVNEETITQSSGETSTIVTKKTRYVDREGKSFIVGIIRDITDRKHAEEALRDSEQFVHSIVENIPDMIFVKDAKELRFVMLNKAAERLIGYSREKLLGKSDHDFFPKNEADFFHENDRSVLRNRVLVDIPEETIHTRAMGIRTLHTKKMPIPDQKGNALYLLGISEDITERKHAEEELEKYRHHLEELIEARTVELVVAKEEADAANRAKSAFLANMSHELRTPLNAILGYAQILQRERRLSERQTLGLSTIREGGEHLLRLINDILDLSKIEAGKLELSPEPFNLPAFLENVASVIRMKAEQQSLLFNYEAPPDLPRAIRADERRLRQVLLNLLGNAVKFTDHGEVSLRVEVLSPTSQHRPAFETQLRFEVRDTGIGMNQDQLKAIFRPFEQVGDMQRRLSGTGLGLAISRQLVRSMGGDIQVASEAGRGSRFWFDLSAPAQARVAGLSEQQCVAGYQGPRKRVMIVDDTPANRMMLVDFLGELGFEVDQAASGEEALERAQAAPPNLVLMDLVMPGIDGLEAARRLRLIEGMQDVPIIAVSASASNTDEKRCLAAGASAFISKPIKQELLLQEIGRLLQLEWLFEGAAQ
jgi:PAS domain S-box-containing protein